METVAIPLLAPLEGVPEIINSESALAKAIAELTTGVGPFAIDAERASGYKYSSRAYLIQIKRTGGGLHLLDPIAFPSDGIHPLFTQLNELLSTGEVILHASTQDLPCLREVGLDPSRLFDTELAGRIAGLPRVGLGPLLESLLGVTLAKEHSAVDWSIRPLPLAWLTYAALDVELLVELRNIMSEILESQGKLAWASEEFASILAARPPEKKKDPWRRTSGMHKIKKRNVLAVVRALWLRRDEIARGLDVSPSKLLSDSALLELAVHTPKNRKEMEKVLRPIGARARWFEQTDEWLNEIESAVALPESEWPQMRAQSDGPPPAKIWREKYPQKYAPLSHARAGIEAKSAELAIPAENLISPEIVRRVIWEPPTGSMQALDVESVESTLRERGARPWQASIVAPLLAAALLEREAITLPESPVETPATPAEPAAPVVGEDKPKV